MSDVAKLEINGKVLELPIVKGTENEKGLDISKLRSETGAITLDHGFVNTGSCMSSITFLNGEKGILKYRGYTIEDLCENSNFMEVAHLLIYGDLPKESELKAFQERIKQYNKLHPGVIQLIKDHPKEAHPMGVLTAMCGSLTAFHPDLLHPVLTDEEKNVIMAKLLAKLKNIAAYTYRRSQDLPIIESSKDLNFSEDFLNMMFSGKKGYEPHPEVARALDLLLILHADHEQNCSASTVRIVGSSNANLFASIAAGVCALWGPLHGGANQAVIEMLEAIQEDGGDFKKFLAKAKDKEDPFRLMGFGHRVYKNFDPRARIIKSSCDDVLNKLGIHDPILDIAKGLEEAALNDPYFQERKLYPNVDFYSGIIYRAIGIPTNMFTVMFALGRLPGWLAQWKEQIESKEGRIGRPRQIYVGETSRKWTPFSNR